MSRRNRRQRPDALISAQEIACRAYCPEQWRLEYGLGLEPANRAALDAGNRHHGLPVAAGQKTTLRLSISILGG